MAKKATKSVKKRQQKQAPKDKDLMLLYVLFWCARAYIHFFTVGKKFYASLFTSITIIFLFFGTPAGDRKDLLIQLATIAASCIKSTYIMCGIIVVCVLIIRWQYVTIRSQGTLFGNVSPAELNKRFAAIYSSRDANDELWREKSNES